MVVVVVTTVVVVTGGREIVAAMDWRRCSGEVEEEVDTGRLDSAEEELPCSEPCLCSVISVSKWAER